MSHSPLEFQVSVWPTRLQGQSHVTACRFGMLINSVILLEHTYSNKTNLFLSSQKRSTFRGLVSRQDLKKFIHTFFFQWVGVLLRSLVQSSPKGPFDNLKLMLEVFGVATKTKKTEHITSFLKPLHSFHLYDQH